MNQGPSFSTLINHILVETIVELKLKGTRSFSLNFNSNKEIR